MNPPLLDWATAFLWTCVIEIPIYTWLLRRHLASPWHAMALGLGLQMATHPALWYAVPQFAPYWAWVTVAETGVVLVEALLTFAALQRRLPVGRALRWAFGVSFLANAISTGVGLAKDAWN